ncbi:hypothetical protein TSUD_12090 [Trifolium subterraneum]|uniref:Uncharacterized protein n=1 Tax=Trifolium subterraneum TaxID=3900 RepID=A0A2Z6MCR9_TRISU|nr:hypothetical protein TSUD_12090 [Trifolium subterraneum]
MFGKNVTVITNLPDSVFAIGAVNWRSFAAAVVVDSIDSSLHSGEVCLNLKFRVGRKVEIEMHALLACVFHEPLHN